MEVSGWVRVRCLHSAGFGRKYGVREIVSRLKGIERKRERGGGGRGRGLVFVIGGAE